MKPRRSELVPILVKLSGKLSARRFSSQVAGYLLDNNMTDELDSLTRDMVSYRAASGVVEVNTVSAHQLSGTALKEVRSKVKQLYPSARQIILNQRIDPDQIGGVRLELPDQQLDLSVRGKLNQFKQLTVDV